MEIVLMNNPGESEKDFINRLHVLAVAKGGPVDGQHGLSYIGEIKPTDDPEKVYKAFVAAKERAFQHLGMELGDENHETF